MEWELRAECRLSVAAVESVAVRSESLLVAQVEAVTATGELCGGNWCQTRSGRTRVKVPIQRRRIRSGLDLVASQEIDVQPQACVVDSPATHVRRCTLWLPGALASIATLTATWYAERATTLRVGPQPCVLELEFRHGEPGDVELLAAETELLLVAGQPLMPELDALLPPNVTPICDSDHDLLAATARIGPFAAKSNGVHELAWPDRTGIVFVRPAAQPRWRMLQRRLAAGDSFGRLLEVERMPGGERLLLSCLTTATVPNGSNVVASWAAHKLWHPTLELAREEAARLGPLADGVIALLDGSVLSPCKLKPASVDLEWAPELGFLTGGNGISGPPSCQLVAGCALDPELQACSSNSPEDPTPAQARDPQLDDACMAHTFVPDFEPPDPDESDEPVPRRVQPGSLGSSMMLCDGEEALLLQHADPGCGSVTGLELVDDCRQGRCLPCVVSVPVATSGSVVARPDRHTPNSATAMLQAVRAASLAGYRPVEIDKRANRSLQDAIRQRSAWLLSRWLPQLPRRLVMLDAGAGTAPFMAQYGPHCAAVVLLERDAAQLNRVWARRVTLGLDLQPLRLPALVRVLATAGSNQLAGLPRLDPGQPGSATAAFWMPQLDAANLQALASAVASCGHQLAVLATMSLGHLPELASALVASELPLLAVFADAGMLASWPISCAGLKMAAEPDGTVTYQSASTGIQHEHAVQISAGLSDPLFTSWEAGRASLASGADRAAVERVFRFVARPRVGEPATAIP